jgi:hypothetical protein
MGIPVTRDEPKIKTKEHMDWPVAVFLSVFFICLTAFAITLVLA